MNIRDVVTHLLERAWDRIRAKVNNNCLLDKTKGEHKNKALFLLIKSFFFLSIIFIKSNVLLRWVLSSLSILGRLSWIDSDALTKFILASQDDETGGTLEFLSQKNCTLHIVKLIFFPGISDRPGDLPDPFHTLFGVAGISLMSKSVSTLKTSSLGEINPVYCMPQTVLDRIGVSHQTLSL